MSPHASPSSLPFKSLLPLPNPFPSPFLGPSSFYPSIYRLAMPSWFPFHLYDGCFYRKLHRTGTIHARGDCWSALISFAFIEFLYHYTLFDLL